MLNLDNFWHLILIYYAIAINVVHPAMIAFIWVEFIFEMGTDSSIEPTNIFYTFYKRSKTLSKRCFSTDLKAHKSFSLGVPADVTSMAIRNSLKSIVPLLSASKVRKTFWQNFSASPDGKNILYMSMKVWGVSFPLGQSCRKPAYHSLLRWLNITLRQRSDLRRRGEIIYINIMVSLSFPVQLYENGNETFGWVFICLAASPTK